MSRCVGKGANDLEFGRTSRTLPLPQLSHSAMNRRRFSSFFYLLGSLALPGGAAEPLSGDGFAFVKTAGGIAEHTLSSNGLSVLLLEDHSAPVLTVMVTYRVGSRNEVTGTTGATHLLEHLMFKGSTNFHPRIGKGFDTLMDSIGGINNATTSYDRTNYYENLPSDQLELALQLEADRMRGLLLREEDRQPEMTVVRNEFERDENDPSSALFKEIAATAFLAHPYHHPVIGWRSDIEKVSIDKLREFYDTFYWPNNATVTLIGDFSTASALTLIKKYFGAIPRSPQPIPQVYTEEPAQSGPRRVIVRRPGELGVVNVAFKVPAATHVDHAPLEILGALLSEGKTSRLYRALIDPNLAVTANAGQEFLRDPTLFLVSATLAPGSNHEQIEKILLGQIAQVQKSGVTPAEVSRALNKLLAGLAFARDGAFAIAGQINEPIAVGNWQLYLTQLDTLRAVTTADVQRVARTYLLEDRSTTGWYIPQAESGASTAPAGPPRRSAFASHSYPNKYYYRDPNLPMTGETAKEISARAGERGPTLVAAAQTMNRSSVSGRGAGGGSAAAALIAPQARRRSLAGIDTVTVKTAVPDVVTLLGVLNAGDIFNPPSNSAMADLTAGMLDQGTLARDKFAMAELIEEAGATLAFSTGAHTLNFSAKCLRKDLPLVIQLLAEQLRTPRFDPIEFAKLKKQLNGQHKRRMEDTDYRAQRAFTAAIFPLGHPNRAPSDEDYLAALETATLAEITAFHTAHYGPSGARLVMVGDLDDAQIEDALIKGFRGWQGGRPFPIRPPAPRLTQSRTERVAMPGKTSVSLVMGQPSGLRYADANYPALSMATAVFGSGFFSARLLDIIRNREGLTYGIGAALTEDTQTDGAWAIHATFAPELLAQGTAATWRELRRFHANGLTADELATFKVTLTGSYKVALATTGGLARTLLNALQRGYDVSWIDTFPSTVQALTLAEVNASITKFLDPEKMVTVFAGSLTSADAALKH